MLAVLQHNSWDLMPEYYSTFALFILDETVVGTLSPDVCGKNGQASTDNETPAACSSHAVSEGTDVSPELRGQASTDNETPAACSSHAVSEGTDVSPELRGQASTDNETPVACSSHAVSEGTNKPDVCGLRVGDDQSPVAFKLQSELCRYLSNLASFSYHIDDISLLTKMVQELKDNVAKCRDLTRQRTVGYFPQRYQRRIGKNWLHSALQRRLHAARRRQQKKKCSRRHAYKQGTNY